MNRNFSSGSESEPASASTKNMEDLLKDCKDKVN